MPRPIAYFLTWTCYGTWLPGDERGSVDATHRAYGKPYAAPSHTRAVANRARLRDEPMHLDDRKRPIVCRTIEDHCRVRDWMILALNVRTNHVHLVLSGCDIDPGKAAGELKAWSTRRLREEGFVRPDQRVWTRMSSTRWLWDDDAVAAAMRYTLEEQGADLAPP